MFYLTLDFVFSQRVHSLTKHSIQHILFQALRNLSQVAISYFFHIPVTQCCFNVGPRRWPNIKTIICLFSDLYSSLQLLFAILVPIILFTTSCKVSTIVPSALIYKTIQKPCIVWTFWHMQTELFPH